MKREFYIFGAVIIACLLTILLVQIYDINKMDAANSLIIGNTYRITEDYSNGNNDGNPFNNTTMRNPITVTIESKLGGYIKYCRSEDYNKPNHISFSLPEIDFEEDINK